MPDHVITIGAFVVRCTLRPSYATTWCLCPRDRWLAVDCQDAPDCMACAREVLWVQQRPTRPIRRLAC